ncbi:metal ABC transporter permease [Nocardia uniformis]|uniref:Metal ABC transporter permease n=1 Tax=Nocardia uniformis TaxID=53432 RepID=A0A849C155_9NOCA|nr:zinc ABC transporter permease AztB [Nocardia uniformis]NNH72354.1 metal ABC transporter permease [Nocardia uniformis]
MEWLIAPFEVTFVQRALWGGLLVSGICALAGTWVVVRGMAFLGQAMAQGLLPGVAVAALLGGNLIVGAAFSAGAMAVGVTALGRNQRFAADTAIGLLFAGMLSLGVIIVSRSQSFAVDVTGLLFGDILAIRAQDVVYLAVALAISLLIAVLGHRAFVALAFDPRTAHTLGLRPRWAQGALLGLLTLAIVASFHVVGTLLVFGLLIAPPAAATYWSHRIPVIMALAALFGGVATVTGLLVSWHAGTAAGATIAAIAVGEFFVSAAVAQLRTRLRTRLSANTIRSRTRLAGSGVNVLVLFMVVGAILPLIGCGTSPSDDVVPEEKPHGYVEGAEEADGPQSRLVVADPDGAVRVVDLITEEVTDGGEVPNVVRMTGDGRFAYPITADAARIVDGGAWTVDHGDHVHYYRATTKDVGSVPRGGATGVHSDVVITAMIVDGSMPRTILLDRAALEAGTVTERGVIDGIALPYAEHLVVVSGSGTAEVRDRDGAAVTPLTESCLEPRGSATTRRGVVFGCADGALMVSADEGRFTAVKIAYPQPVPAAERATEFTHRAGSTALAARAGDRGAWVLDSRAHTWVLVETGPVVAANTAGEGSALLTLTRDGVLHAHDLTTGVESARTQVLTAAVSGDTSPVIEIDTNRAYINDAEGRAVHEIDYRDNLRRARTFPLDITPAHMVETGR